MRRRIRTYGVLLLLTGLAILQVNAQDLQKTLRENDSRAEALTEAGKLDEAAGVFSESAKLLYQNNRLEEAAGYFEKALKINKDLGYGPQMMKLESQLSNIYLSIESYQKAIPHLKELVSSYKAKGDLSGRINALINLALAQNETADYDLALNNSKSAFDFSMQKKDLLRQIKSTKLISQIYKNKGNNAEAEKYTAIAKALEDRLTDEKRAEADQKVSQANTEKALTEKELSKTRSDLEVVTELTREQQLELQVQEAELDAERQRVRLQVAELEAERERTKAEKQKIIYLTSGLIILLLFVFALTFMILKIRKANKKINQQHLSLTRQNKEIKASIRYAQTIQQAMLPADAQIDKFFESYILYRPKDIVSGDFYWIYSQMENKKEVIYFAVVDCTGHGVPGAFMSMIGNRLLNEIVSERKIESPAEILVHLNSMVREALRQEETDNNDGMDLALCRFEPSEKSGYTMTFAGAKRPVYIIDNDNNKLLKYAGDRKSIGGYNLSRREVKFTDHQHKLKKGDMIYLFSDGIIDQNGPDRKKFGRLRLEEAIVEGAKLSPVAQKQLVEQRLNEYMQQEDQRDDIAMVGLKLV